MGQTCLFSYNGSMKGTVLPQILRSSLVTCRFVPALVMNDPVKPPDSEISRLAINVHFRRRRGWDCSPVRKWLMYILLKVQGTMLGRSECKVFVSRCLCNVQEATHKQWSKCMSTYFGSVPQPDDCLNLAQTIVEMPAIGISV